MNECVNVRSGHKAVVPTIVIFAFKYTGDEMFEIISPLALQYYFENEEHNVIPPPNGNSKKGKFLRNTGSLKPDPITRDKLKNSEIMRMLAITNIVTLPSSNHKETQMEHTKLAEKSTQARTGMKKRPFPDINRFLHDLVASNEEVFRPIFRICNDLTLDLHQRNVIGKGGGIYE
uniref:Uncharacterized protein n=1 Tax=Magallana gigas TaxID=29159 RepID=K1R3Y3_MAGGI